MVVVVFIIVACLVAIIAVNVAIFVYITYAKNKSEAKRRGQRATISADNHALLLVSTEEEVDKPSSATPPTAPDKNDKDCENRELSEAEEKLKEAMDEEERYQPCPTADSEKVEEITV